MKMLVWLPYGLILALGIIFIKTIEYRLFSFRYSHELYSGLLAVFFLLLGLAIAYLLFRQPATEARSPKDLSQPLTASERRVLEGLVEGYSNQQLAEHNNVSINTIKSHLKNLYRKLEVNNRAEAVALAKQYSNR